MALPDAVHETISHFLTEFSPDQKVCKTEDYILTFLRKRYAPDYATDIINKFAKTIFNNLIEEYESRVASKELLRFKLLDASGQRVSGMGKAWQRRLRVFQDALNDLSDSEFEALSARVLAVLGCTDVWTTPLSHDQGLDSFGYASLLPRTVPSEIARQCRVVYLAQAKHYKKHKIGSRDIREFVGSVELAIYKIYSTEDHKYRDLAIKPFGPGILVFITTEELPRTVKLMGRNAGIVVLSAQELAVLFARGRIVPQKRCGRSAIVKALRRTVQGLRTAK